MCNRNNYISTFALVLDVEKYQSMSIFYFLRPCLFSRGKYTKASSTPQRAARGPWRRRKGKNGKGRKKSDCKIATLLDGPSTWILKFSEYEHAVVPLSFARAHSCALHFAVVITSCPETLLSTVFPLTQHEKSAEVGGRMVLSVIVSCADTQGPPRGIPHFLHVRLSRTGSKERRRATPNSQPTERIDIVPREWVSGMMLAISRPGNCFAASERTAREVNDTRPSVETYSWISFRDSADLSYPKVRVPFSPFLRWGSQFNLSFGRITKQSILFPPALLPRWVHCEESALPRHAPAYVGFVARNNDRWSSRRSQSRSLLLLGMRKYLTNTTTHARSRADVAQSADTILSAVEVRNSRCHWTSGNLCRTKRLKQTRNKRKELVTLMPVMPTNRWLRNKMCEW